jgi:transcriptional regulator with XRE-family HTH domain
MAPSTLDWQGLGERLHAARRRQKLRSQDLAHRAGTSRMTISRLENTKKPQVTFDVIWRIAQVLQVSLDWLAGQVTEPAPAPTTPPKRPRSRKTAPVG